MDPRRSKDSESQSYMPIIVIALLAMIGWQYFFPAEKPAAVAPENTEVSVNETATGLVDALGAPQVVIGDGTAVSGADVGATAASVVATPRKAVMSDLVSGSVALKGGRLDELDLLKYKEEMNGDKNVTIFAPSGKDAHFFDAGWQSKQILVPSGSTLWTTDGDKLTPSTPLVLSWNNGHGQTFTRTFSLEKDGYTVRIVDEITNHSNDAVLLGHYAQIHKVHHKAGSYSPEESTFYNFLGPIAYIDGIKYEHDYEDVKDNRIFNHEGVHGWLGIKSRYFLAAIVPDQQNEELWKIKHSLVNGTDFFSAIVQMPGMVSVAGNGGTYTKSYRVYAGPNIRSQMVKESVGLEQSVDYGWFHVISLPLFKMIMWFNSLVGNLGFSIILGTIVLKLILFPLANKSYRAMAKMKQLQPELVKLREKHGDDKQAAAMEMMALYKQYKVNPMSGCWPVLIQIPIFFAFYKVILVSFEFRHAPFIGWITDLSAKDPYYILPVIMGVTMYIQQTLNPSAGDPIQDKVMKVLPVLFTFMFMMFPAGLVLYWTVNNIMSVGQQYIIMKKMKAV